jgi:hypothetical protein
MPNRFEQVDETVDDAITLNLRKENGIDIGTVTCPSGISSGRLPNDMTSGKLPAKDAFRAAIAFANDVKAAVVVHDPDSIWQADWGELYRYEDDAGASG